jgi:hypothetical protein
MTKDDIDMKLVSQNHPEKGVKIHSIVGKVRQILFDRNWFHKIDTGDQPQWSKNDLVYDINISKSHLMLKGIMWQFSGIILSHPFFLSLFFPSPTKHSVLKPRQVIYLREYRYAKKRQIYHIRSTIVEYIITSNQSFIVVFTIVLNSLRQMFHSFSKDHLDVLKDQSFRDLWNVPMEHINASLTHDLWALRWEIQGDKSRTGWSLENMVDDQHVQASGARIQWLPLSHFGIENCPCRLKKIAPWSWRWNLSFS